MLCSVRVKNDVDWVFRCRVMVGESLCITLRFQGATYHGWFEKDIPRVMLSRPVASGWFVHVVFFGYGGVRNSGHLGLLLRSHVCNPAQNDNNPCVTDSGPHEVGHVWELSLGVQFMRASEHNAPGTLGLCVHEQAGRSQRSVSSNLASRWEQSLPSG